VSRLIFEEEEEEEGCCYDIQLNPLQFDLI